MGRLPEEQRYADEQRFEKRLYELEFESRLDAARKELIDEAGRKGRAFTLRWLGADNFNPEMIDKKARRKVEQDRLRARQRLEAKECEELSAYLDSCPHRLLKEKPKEEFSRATCRRGGPDRRR